MHTKQGAHNGVIISHEIVAGYEGTDKTTDQLQHIHNCTQLVILRNKPQRS